MGPPRIEAISNTQQFATCDIYALLSRSLSKKQTSNLYSTNGNGRFLPENVQGYPQASGSTR